MHHTVQEFELPVTENSRGFKINRELQSVQKGSTTNDPGSPQLIKCDVSCKSKYQSFLNHS